MIAERTLCHSRFQRAGSCLPLTRMGPSERSVIIALLFQLFAAGSQCAMSRHGFPSSAARGALFEFQLSSMHFRAGNFHGATRAGRNPKPKAVQFDDRGDHAQAEAQAFGVSTFV